MKERALTNHIKLCGIRTGEIEFSHEIFGERFYKTYIECMRKSGNIDTLPVIFPEVFQDNIEGLSRIAIDGRIETRNVDGEDGKRHLEISVFALNVYEGGDVDENEFDGDGFICKHPIYRKTPLGRELADITIAFNRAYGKSDYVPSIAWNRNANRVSGYKVGTHLNVKGRLQSRVYQKVVGDEVFERTAYELSLFTVEVVE